MRRWVARLPFRGQLTFWWSLAFGLLLAVANLAIYAAFDIYLRRDLDRKVRTVAATELASSTDGPGSTCIRSPRMPLRKASSPTRSCVLAEDGTVRLASPSIRDRPPLVGLDLVMAALEGRAHWCHWSSTIAPGARRCSARRSAGSATPSWLACSGMTSTPISPAWPGCWVSSG